MIDIISDTNSWNLRFYLVMLVLLLILIGIFLLIRKFVLWYYKINKRTELLEQILEELKKLNVNK